MRESDRPRRKKTRSSRGDGDGVPMWAKVGAGVIAILGLIGTIVRFVERRAKPDPAPNAAVAPAQPMPMPAPEVVRPKNEPPAPAPPRVRVSTREPPAAARELVATITRVSEVESQIQGKPFDLVVEYDYGSTAPLFGPDALVYTTTAQGAATLIEGNAARGTNRFSPLPNDAFDGETRFWIERQERGKPFQRISNIYTHRR